MMNTQDIDKRIGMPNIDKEWATFHDEVINRKPRHMWTLSRVAAIVVVAFSLSAAAASVALYVSQSPGKASCQRSRTGATTGEETRPMVQHKTNPTSRSKSLRSTYTVHLCEGTYVDLGSGNKHIEEAFFSYVFPEGSSEMQLDGKPFDKDHLPTLTNKDLKALVVKKHGDTQTVCLLTQTPLEARDAKGNLPREMTLLLPGGGKLYFTKDKAQQGNWMNCSCTSWEKGSQGWCITDEFAMAKEKPGFKAYIYASTEASKADIDRARQLMKKMEIRAYEVVTDIPVHHYTDSDLHTWAQQQRAAGVRFADLYDKMAPNGMTCEDVRRQWHIVKAVYGKGE